MFGKKKSVPQIDKEQLELIENAQRRVRKKKALYRHFVIFLIASVFFIVANIGMGIGEEFKFLGVDWFVIAIVIWAFFLCYHAFSVFVTHKFMDKAWEEKQIAKLVDKQNQRIEKLKADLPSDESLLKKLNTTFTKSDNLTIIVAAAENNAIGKDNKLIWHISDDLKRFKSLTSGHHVIMGRKTFESFPKPLPNRTHVVITRQEDYKAPEGVIVVNTLEDAIAASKNDDQPFIIGGGEIYKQAMEVADKIEITRVHATFDADTFFPEIDKSIWKETAHEFHEKSEKNDFDFTFLTYERK
ncbi:dihydrofolate reductase [Aestuariibaculum sediminum]|uniref:dihydrofolate reductase n=1 Tax=Aestuariibaculum sediminum TaxID=2770637 RepID=A0A8J6U885_9FLAO|nr:dihydrofolate reductase [Aestuariibaculum sediminum]MBD0832980.1 dihydrofolate reductase [Aestuariibaculum sediminum]